MISIIIGVLIIVAAVAAVIMAIHKTPQNLRGFYSMFYWIIASIALIAGIYMVITGLIQVFLGEL